MFHLKFAHLRCNIEVLTFSNDGVTGSRVPLQTAFKYQGCVLKFWHHFKSDVKFHFIPLNDYWVVCLDCCFATWLKLHLLHNTVAHYIFKWIIWKIIIQNKISNFKVGIRVMCLAKLELVATVWFKWTPPGPPVKYITISSTFNGVKWNCFTPSNFKPNCMSTFENLTDALYMTTSGIAVWFILNHPATLNRTLYDCLRPRFK